MFHRNPHRGERREAADNRDGGKDKQNILQLERNRIILNDIVSGAVTKANETDILLQQNGHYAQNQPDDAADDRNYHSFVHEDAAYQRAITSHGTHGGIVFLLLDDENLKRPNDVERRHHQNEHKYQIHSEFLRFHHLVQGRLLFVLVEDVVVGTDNFFDFLFYLIQIG